MVGRWRWLGWADGAAGCCGEAKENRPWKRSFLMSAQHNDESRTSPVRIPFQEPQWITSTLLAPHARLSHVGSRRLCCQTPIRSCPSCQIVPVALPNCQCPADALCSPSEAPALHVALCSCTYGSCIILSLVCRLQQRQGSVLLIGPSSERLPSRTALVPRPWAMGNGQRAKG